MITGSLADDIHCTWANGKCVLSTLLSNNSYVCNAQPSKTNFEEKCNTLSKKGCGACLASSYNCTYCPTTETCHYADITPSCSSKCDELYGTYCSLLTNCFQCESSGHTCNWKGNTCQMGKTTEPVCNINKSCSQLLTCSECTQLPNCLWCLNRHQCIPSNAYTVQFPYGQCFEWTNSEKGCNDYECLSLKTCDICQRNSKCGWCDDGSHTGSGYCLEGGGSGPINATSHVVNVGLCPTSRWHFATCPSCQCNGHSTCTTDGQCVQCENNTSGSQCQSCMEGYFGDALNRGTCQKCVCNNKANTCNAFSGSCFCFTKGVIGHACNKCDYSSGYFGNATKNGTCFYKLTENYQFKFTFTRSADEYISQINFKNTPSAQDDVQMSFESQKPVTIVLEVSIPSLKQDHTMLVAENISSLQYTFSANNFSLGTDSNSTILIYISNIPVPCWIKVRVGGFTLLLHSKFCFYFRSL